MTLSGSGFLADATQDIVTFEGPDNTALAATVTSATANSLNVTVPAGAVTGNVIVVVGSKSSTGVTFTVNVTSPQPELSSISPDNAMGGLTSVQIQAIGMGFTSTSVVRVDEVPMASTYVNPTLMLAVLSGNVLNPGVHSVTVYTPPTGGGESAAQEFTVGYPRPVINSISPASTSQGSTAAVTITGTGFTSATMVLVDGTATNTVFVSSTTVQVSLTLDTGSHLISLVNPSPGGGQSGSVMFTVNAPVISPVAAVVLISTSGQSAQVGTQTQVTVELRDASNHPYTGGQASFSISTGNGTLSSYSGTSDTQGRITITLTLGTTAGSNSVFVSAGSGTATFNETGTAGPAVKLAIATNPTSFRAGSAGSMLTVQVQDQYGNLRTDAVDAITLQITAGTGTFGNSAPSAVSGSAVTTLTSTVAGTISVQATAASRTAATANVTVSPGDPASITISSGNNQNGQAGLALVTPLQVLVKDTFNNPVPGVSVAFGTTATGASVNPTSIATNSSGIAQTTATAGSVAGTQTFSASSRARLAYTCEFQ